MGTEFIFVGPVRVQFRCAGKPSFFPFRGAGKSFLLVIHIAAGSIYFFVALGLKIIRG